MTSLEQLRADPEVAIGTSDFFVDVRGFKPTAKLTGRKGEEGGAVTIQELKEKQEGVTCLTLKPGGSDFFFPWTTPGSGGVGEVRVPVNQPNGIIVATGGMNGCALQVNRNGSNLIFYHDADSKSLKEPEGTKLCRIEPSLYMKIPYGETLVKEFQTKGIDVGYLYQILCVRHANRWKVVYSGIIFQPGPLMSMRVIRSFTPGVSKFLVSFDE